MKEKPLMTYNRLIIKSNWIKAKIENKTVILNGKYLTNINYPIGLTYKTRDLGILYKNNALVYDVNYPYQKGKNKYVFEIWRA